jgi:hypothetical protein
MRSLLSVSPRPCVSKLVLRSCPDLYACSGCGRLRKQRRRSLWRATSSSCAHTTAASSLGSLSSAPTPAVRGHALFAVRWGLTQRVAATYTAAAAGTFGAVGTCGSALVLLHCGGLPRDNWVAGTAGTRS